jgi:hypothetical protein
MRNSISEACADEVTNDRFNIKKAGVYLVTASWTTGQWLDDNKQILVSIGINGSAVKRARNYSPGANNSVTVSITDLLELAVGDYVEMFVFHNQGSTQTTDINNNKAMMSVVQQ